MHEIPTSDTAMLWKGVQIGIPMAPVCRTVCCFTALVRDYPQLLDTGMKRQDVVHSFLRFGRRR